MEAKFTAEEKERLREGRRERLWELGKESRELRGIKAAEEEGGNEGRKKNSWGVGRRRGNCLCKMKTFLNMEALRCSESEYGWGNAAGRRRRRLVRSLLSQRANHSPCTYVSSDAACHFPSHPSLTIPVFLTQVTWPED